MGTLGNLVTRSFEDKSWILEVLKILDVSKISDGC